MKTSSTDIEYRRLTTPRAAAIAGFLFGLLFSASLVLLRDALPEEFTTDTTWVTSGAHQIRWALGMMPFAGIAYLWFIGVVRDKLSELEDRFFHRFSMAAACSSWQWYSFQWPLPVESWSPTP